MNNRYIHPILILTFEYHLKVRDQLASKFGKEFMIDAMENKNDKVNEKVREKKKSEQDDRPSSLDYYKTSSQCT